MLVQSLRTLFKRDLQKLRSEIAAYRQEDKLWYIEKDIPNAAGNLCLHLVGNLNTYIGKELGNTGYVRQRELEFSLKNIPRETLLQQLDETITIVDQTLEQLRDEQLSEDYPAMVFDFPMTTGHFLIHLAMHLGYHLGQVNYHRRLLDAAS